MTRKRFEGDPIAALRGIDPLDSPNAPGDTTGAHARALFLEVTSMDVVENKAAPQPKQPLKRKLALGVGMAVVVAAIAGGAYALLKDEAEEAIVGGEPIGDAMAMCLQYTDQMLLDQEYAFDGTLVAVDGNNATFDVQAGTRAARVHRSPSRPRVWSTPKRWPWSGPRSRSASAT